MFCLSEYSGFSVGKFPRPAAAPASSLPSRVPRRRLRDPGRGLERFGEGGRLCVCVCCVCVFVLSLSVCRLALVYTKYTQSPWPIQGIALLLPLAYRASAICDGVRRYSASLSPPSRVRGGSCVILVGSGEVCRVRVCVCVCWIVVFCLSTTALLLR